MSRQLTLFPESAEKAPVHQEFANKPSSGNLYATTLDVALNAAEVNPEAILKLRILLNQQAKRCLVSATERVKFLQLLELEMRLKQSNSNPANLVRKALLLMNLKSL